MLKLKVTTVGSSAGVVLPKEALMRLKVEKGDFVSLTETADGYQVSAFDPEFEKALDASRKITRRYRNALRELAK